ncbi:hypothetical protein [Alicyclobacillus sp. SP_1]|uniref:hypothetical protein n=1 Tax=Alicyclobacillus sp. SP_1 TaxID=2942475 RepID=UPI0021588611|nr:hypothetical protein [Alicyclobacillus sp. SP_1]
MKRTTKAAAATVLALSAAPLMATQAMAATTYSKADTVIQRNGTTLLHAVHLIAVDPWSHESTSWLPVYYLNEAMHQAGFTAAWHGTTETWSLTVPSTYSTPPDVANPPSVQATNSAKMAIALNGTVVAYAPRLVAPDPYSGVETTYVPIYYVMQVMKRVGITPTWNGTDWDFDTHVLGSTHPTPTAPSSPESQTAMASAMWAMFDAKTWDVVTHPTMAQAGVTPTSGAVTAGEAATWLADWASHAMGYSSSQYGVTHNPSFQPWSLRYEASQNPFTWAQINGLYAGTTLGSSNNELSALQAQTVLSNLQYWLNGYKTLSNGVVQMHVPFYSKKGLWQLVEGKVLTQSQYDAILTDDTKYYDQVTLTRVGQDIDLSLPSTAHSVTGIEWSVGDGASGANPLKYGYFGGEPGPGRSGGLTLKAPLASDTGLSIGMYSLAKSFTGSFGGYGLRIFTPFISGNMDPAYQLDESDGQSILSLPPSIQSHID